MPASYPIAEAPDDLDVTFGDLPKAGAASATTVEKKGCAGKAREEFSSSVIRLARINGVLLYHDRRSVQVASGEDVLRIFAPRSKTIVKHAVNIGEVSWSRLGSNPRSRDVQILLPKKRYLFRFATGDEADCFVMRLHRDGAERRGSLSPRQIPSDTTSVLSGATSTSATSSRPGTARSWLKK